MKNEEMKTLTTTQRSHFSTLDTVLDLWNYMGLPKDAIEGRVTLTGNGLEMPSSFKVGQIAQASIAISALTAGLILSLHNGEIPHVTVPLRHACAEYKAESLYTIDGETQSGWGPIGGLHQAADGHVRIHDGFPNHRYGALKLLGLTNDATREDVARATLKWCALDLEQQAFMNDLVIVALRSYDQWDSLQADAISNVPIEIELLKNGIKKLPLKMSGGATKCLQGLRVIELSRVIAAPLAGKTLAAHGADVMWVTSPHLPDLPAVDREFSRGKRSVQLDLDRPEDTARLMNLVKDADVFIQSYRPGSLAARGISAEQLADINPNIVYASLNAFGNEGPWAGNRGFDSIVQTCSGMNVSEAEHYGDGSDAKPLPCQALDHTAGYLLAAGINAALYKRATQGGAYSVHVSLAGCMRYLRSLGQYEGQSGFDCEDMVNARQVEDLMESRETAFGIMKYVRHAASLEGLEVGATRPPVPLGSDQASWS